MAPALTILGKGQNHGKIMKTAAEITKENNAQFVNSILLEAGDSTDSITTAVGVIVTRQGKLRGNGELVTIKYFENDFYTSIEVWLEGKTGFSMEVQGSGFEESELRAYAMGAYFTAVARTVEK